MASGHQRGLGQAGCGGKDDTDLVGQESSLHFQRTHSSGLTGVNLGAVLNTCSLRTCSLRLFHEMKKPQPALKFVCMPNTTLALL